MEKPINRDINTSRRGGEIGHEPSNFLLMTLTKEREAARTWGDGKQSDKLIGFDIAHEHGKQLLLLPSDGRVEGAAKGERNSHKFKYVCIILEHFPASSRKFRGVSSILSPRSQAK